MIHFLPVFLSNLLPGSTVTCTSGGPTQTANQASFILYQLASNPECQRALQAELDREWPAGEPLSAAVLERLKYVRAVVKETMRLQFTVSGIQRTVSKDVNLMGYHIPKGVSKQHVRSF